MGRSRLEQRLTDQLKARGVSNANDKARQLLVKRGHTDKNGNLTPAGKKRQDLGNEGRAKDRESKRTGRSSSDYNYNPDTNRATLKKGAKRAKRKR